MSTYPIFSNNKKQTLVFYSCPKNANTSVKLFFARHLGIENNFYFIEDEIPKYMKEESHKKRMEIKEKNTKTNLINIWPNHQKFSKADSTFKCCIIRCPIERFLSAYKNRILYHKDDAFKNLSIDKVIENLINNNIENLHFLPQTYYLGNNLKYFDCCVDIKNIQKFIDYVNNFFGIEKEFPKLQTGGNNNIVDLTAKQIENLKKIYFDDYNLLKTK